MDMNREDIMANNNAASDKEKVVTKYDRKIQKRWCFYVLPIN